MTRSPAYRATAQGLAAILLWSTTIALTRYLADRLGLLTSTALTYGGAGVLGVLWLTVRGELRTASRLPRRYLVVCGACFVVYAVSLTLAIGAAHDGAELLAVALVNYLWPALTLVFAIPVLGHRARWTLWPSLACAMAGAGLAMLGPQASLATASRAAIANPVAVGFAAVAAVSWGLYSTLSRRLAADHPGNAVPFFLAASGIALMLGLPWAEEVPRWSPAAVGVLIGMMALPGLAAYAFWDAAMRRGRVALVASASYATPLLAAGFIAVVQGVPARGALLLAALLVTIGAFGCRWSVAEGR